MQSGSSKTQSGLSESQPGLSKEQSADAQAMHIQMANWVSRISRPDRELLVGTLQRWKPVLPNHVSCGRGAFIRFDPVANHLVLFILLGMQSGSSKSQSGLSESQSGLSKEQSADAQAMHI